MIFPYFFIHSSKLWVKARYEHSYNIFIDLVSVYLIHLDWNALKQDMALAICAVDSRSFYSPVRVQGECTVLRNTTSVWHHKNSQGCLEVRIIENIKALEIRNKHFFFFWTKEKTDLLRSKNSLIQSSLIQWYI